MTVAEYAELIGIPEKFLREYAAISDFKTKDGKSALSIPYSDKSGEITRTRYRFGDRDEKEMRWAADDTGKPIEPYGLAWFNLLIDEAWLAEGETDTLSFFYRGLNVLGVPGCSMFKDEWVAKYLANIKTLYLAFDNDEAGRKLTERVVGALRERRFKGVVKVIDLKEIA